MSIGRTLLCIVVFSIAICSGVQADIAVPSLDRAVTDLTATLSAQETAILENSLRNFSTKKGSQIAVLIVPTTQPETIEQYSIRIVDQWKLGRKNIDDGVLLLIAKDDRTVRIEVGYGLEGALTDFATKRIIDELIVPEFKNGNFVGGINAGVAAIIKVIQGEQLPAPALEKEELSFGHLLFFALIAAVFLGSFTRSLFGKVFGSFASAAIAFVIALFFITLLGALLIAFVTFVITLLGNFQGVGRNGPFGGGSSRGGGFGGGGGRFGGGGASGKW